MKGMGIMKNKISIFLVATLIVFVLTACGSGAGKAEEKKEEPKPEVSEEVEDSESEAEEQERPEEVAEADEGTESEESAEGTDEADDPTDQEAAPSEETEGEITDDQMQELYACIKESVRSKYLEPNGISPEEFVWPKEVEGNVANQEELAWYYLVHMFNSYVLEGKLYDYSDFPYDMPSESNRQLMDAVYDGIITWHELPGNTSICLVKLPVRFDQTIPANVDFSAE